MLLGWPPKTTTSSHVTNLIKTRAPVAKDSTWIKYNCEIGKFYDDYIKARLAVKMRVNDSSYETEKELGRGCRKKTTRKLSSSEDDTELPPLKKSKIPPAPKLTSMKKDNYFKGNSNSSTKLNLNISTDIRIIIINRVKI